MDDTISRAGAIDALERIFDRCEEIEAHLPEGDPDRVGYKMYPDWLKVWKYLHRLPSAQPTIEPEPHWISVSERLPREEEQDDELGVLVTLGNGYSGLQCDWYHGDHWYDWDGFVVAWMPLPEPYKEDGTEGR